MTGDVFEGIQAQPLAFDRLPSPNPHVHKGLSMEIGDLGISTRIFGQLMTWWNCPRRKCPKSQLRLEPLYSFL